MDIGLLFITILNIITEDIILIVFLLIYSSLITTTTSSFHSIKFINIESVNLCNQNSL